MVPTSKNLRKNRTKSGFSGITTPHVENRIALHLRLFSKISLMNGKETSPSERQFVAFASQVSMKGMVKIDAMLFGDCMGRRVLYLGFQKRGGGSSVFRLNGDGAV